MARKVKCPECGTFNDKENTISHNSRYYCKICYENYMREAQEYKELIAYICELFQVDAPTPLMCKQIKDYKDQFNYTYRGMKTTLNYFFEIQAGNDPMDSLGIGIVPFVYDEAKKFYIDKKAVKDSISGCNMEELQNSRRIIRKKQFNDFNKNTYKDIVFIDIEQLT